MTTDNDGEQNSSVNGGVEPQSAPVCGPQCDCGKLPAKVSIKPKIAICLVVVVAIAGILFFKASSARQEPSLTGTNGFADSQAGKGTVTNSANQKGGSGMPISAIVELNSVAAELDTVFLIIPGKDNAPTIKATGAILASAERTLNAKGFSTGVFTLQTASPDYPGIAARVTPPGLVVLTKGRGIGFVVGEISETSLMQAYVASTRSGGCSPGGCPKPGNGQVAAPCN